MDPISHWYANIDYSAIVATIALLQTWVIAAWLKWGRRPKIDFHAQSNIEICFSLFGPTIGIEGTLRGLDKDQFVSKMSCTVVRKKDKATQMFEWAISRSSEAPLNNLRDIKVQLASGFRLSPSEPHRFNIQFHSNHIRKELAPLMAPIRDEWAIYLAAQEQQLKANERAMTLVKEQPKVAASYFMEDFRKNNLYQQIADELKRRCYWEPGEYEGTLDVFTSRPDRTTSWKFNFQLNAMESDQLRRNVNVVLDTTTTNNDIPFYFAFPEYSGKVKKVS